MRRGKDLAEPERIKNRIKSVHERAFANQMERMKMMALEQQNIAMSYRSEPMMRFDNGEAQ